MLPLLCDPIWPMSSCSSETCLEIAILRFLYLLYKEGTAQDERKVRHGKMGNEWGEEGAKRKKGEERGKEIKDKGGKKGKKEIGGSAERISK